jgi:hypothetical protein
MRSRSLQYLGALICLLYLGQATIVPAVHLFRHSTEASSSTSCEKSRGQKLGEPVFDTICKGSCSDPEHNHHQHRHPHDSDTCRLCSSKQASGLYGSTSLSPVFDQPNPIVGGIAEDSLQAILTDNSSPRAPPFLLL